MESLEEKCIFTIVHDFNYVMELFKAGFDLQVIQKVFSKVLLRKLCKLNKMDESYLVFFVNPYLKDLCLDNAMPDKPMIILNRLFEIGPTFQSFIMKWPVTWSADNVALAMMVMTGLKDVHIRVRFEGHQPLAARMKSFDSLFGIIGHYCPLIENLEIEGVYLSVRGLKNLCPFNDNNQRGQNCVIRDFGNTCMANNEAASFALEHFPKLVQLKHPHLINLLHTTWVKCENSEGKIFPTYNLSKFKLAGTLWSPMVKAILTLCPRVEEIEINTSLDLGKGFLDLCSEFQHLKKVLISDERRWPVVKPPIDYSEFFKAIGSNLVSIEMNGIHFYSAYHLCKYCPKLEKLIFINVTFGECPEDIEAEQLSLPHLSCLTFCNINFYKETNLHGFHRIMSSCGPYLKNLHLSMWYKENYYLSEDVITPLYNSLKLCFNSVEVIELDYINCSSFIANIIKNATKLQLLDIPFANYRATKMNAIQALCKERNGLKLRDRYAYT